MYVRAMSDNVRITFRGLEPSPYVEERIREKAGKLFEHSSRIQTCDVVVDSPDAHHHKGGAFHVTLEVSIPGRHLVVNRDSGEDHSHEDVYVAIRDAFDAMTRQLDDIAGKQRARRRGR